MQLLLRSIKKNENIEQQQQQEQQITLKIIILIKTQNAYIQNETDDTATARKHIPEIEINEIVGQMNVMLY